MIDTDSYRHLCFGKSSSIVTRKIAGELILVPIQQQASDVESIYTMNEVSTFIWEMIDGENTVAIIRDAVVEEFAVEPEEAETDLVEFLLQLEHVGTVRRV